MKSLLSLYYKKLYYKKYFIALCFLLAVLVYVDAISQHKTLVSVSKTTKVTICPQGRGDPSNLFVKFIFNNGYSTVATAYNSSGEYQVPAKNGEQLSQIAYVTSTGTTVDVFDVNIMTYAINNTIVPNNALTGEDVNICLELGYALKYYEISEGGAINYYSFGDALPTNNIVTNDGYCIEFPVGNGSYVITIGSTSYTYNRNNSGTWTTIPTGWTRPQSFTGPKGASFRIYIPNSVAEGAGVSNTPISIRLNHPGASGAEVLSSYFVPRFPLEIYPALPSTPPNSFKVRSPRHLANINTAFAGFTYTQDLDIDFSLYRKVITVNTNNTITLNTNSSMPTNAVTVSSTFSGTYEGQNKSIRNIVTNINNSSNVGVFSQNQGVIRNIIVQNPTISSASNIGGIVGTNTAPGEILNSSVQYILPSTGSTLRISGTGTNIGGIAGANTGTIRQCFVKASPASGANLNKYPTITGTTTNNASNIGGIVGANSGTIEQCYVDFIWVSGASNIGGVVGTNSAGGNISSVFYNYADASPQRYSFEITVAGASNSGGLIGNMQGGSLSNSYSTACMTAVLTPTTNNYITGAKAASATITNTYYLYRSNIYNNTDNTSGVAPATIAQLRGIAASGNVVLGTGWTQGPGYNSGATPNIYPYPILDASVIGDNTPVYFPMPDTVFNNLQYYEKYIAAGTNNITYKLWNEDSLDNDKKIIEDGYIIKVIGKNNNGNCQILLRNALTNAQLTSINQQDQTIAALSTDPNVSYLVLNLSTLENYAQGLVPIRLTVAGPPGNTIYYDGYFNPLYAKAIFETLPSTNSNYYDNYEYTIRTPRHLRNIAYSANTLQGTFRQDVDIDYSGLNTNNGYFMNPTITNTNNNNKISINISNSIVYRSASLRIFSGKYTAIAPLTGEIYAIKNIAMSNKGEDNIMGVFNTISAAGVVNGLRLENSHINNGFKAGWNIFTGISNESKMGLIAGVNNGTIDSIFIKSSSVIDSMHIIINLSSAGTDVHLGGIAGDNTGTIKDSNIDSSKVMSHISTIFDILPYNRSYMGGVAGYSSGTVERVQAIGMDIAAVGTGSGAAMGGIVGYNTSNVRDVSFVSNKNSSPITQDTRMNVNIGGIVGNNATGGNITRALFLARAPREGSDLYPLRGTNTATLSDSYFLRNATNYNNGTNYGGGVTQAMGRTTSTLSVPGFTTNWAATWSTNWKHTAAPAYPYPWLRSIPDNLQPTIWPIVN